MKLLSLALFALTATVSCVFGATPAELDADAKKIAATVTELHMVIGQVPLTGADDAHIERIGFAARALINDLKHGTANVQTTASISVTVATNLVGILTPVKAESVSTLQELVARIALFLRYKKAIVVILRELVRATDGYADACLHLAPSGFIQIITQLKFEMDASYSGAIQAYSV